MPEFQLTLAAAAGVCHAIYSDRLHSEKTSAFATSAAMATDVVVVVVVVDQLLHYETLFFLYFCCLKVSTHRPKAAGRHFFSLSSNGRQPLT